ncbi:MAG TPA: hypothetical protein VG710_17175 [Opitutus sp.]|nr:hypothetical protein [Opitutus sp.]
MAFANVMKLPPLLLAGSLAANAILAFALWRPHLSHSPTTSADPAGPAPAGSVATAGDATKLAGATRSTPSAPGRWTGMSSGDLKDQIARLRAGGWPPAIIRAIVAAEVREQLAARYFHGLLDGLTEEPFWSAKWNMGIDPKILAAQRSLGQEQTRILTDLLGDDAIPNDEFAQFVRHHQYGDIPADKVDQIQRIGADYQDLRQGIFDAARGGPLTVEDQAKLSYLDQQMRTDLGKVLTPGQLEEYLMHSSMSAGML